MSRQHRSPTRTRRFIIVIALCSLVAGGVSLAADTNSFGSDREGREIGRPGNGPGHDFVDRLNELLARMGRMLGATQNARLVGGQAGSCLHCPVQSPVIGEPPVLPEPRPNTNRPRNRGAGGGSGNWLFPR